MDHRNACTVIPLRLGAANAYFLKGFDGKYSLIDCGMPTSGQRILKVLSDLKVDAKQLKLIIVTHGHADHMGACSFLRKATGAKTVIHRMDAEVFKTGLNPALNPTSKKGWLLNQFTGKKIRGFTPYEPELVIREGLPLYDFGIPGKIMETPGHTSGSISALLDDGTLFVGDLIMGGIIGKGKPQFSMFVDNMAQLKESIRRVIEISPRILYTGHGGPFSSDGVRSAFRDKL